MLSRLGNASCLLHLYPSSLGGGQEPLGEHAGLLLWHQGAPAAAAVPRGHWPHWWEVKNVTLNALMGNFAQISVVILRMDYPPIIFQCPVWPCTCLTPSHSQSGKHNFRVLRHGQIPVHTSPPTVISARMLWCLNRSNSDTSTQSPFGSQLSQSKSSSSLSRNSLTSF